MDKHCSPVLTQHGNDTSKRGEEQTYDWISRSTLTGISYGMSQGYYKYKCEKG